MTQAAEDTGWQGEAWFYMSGEQVLPLHIRQYVQCPPVQETTRKFAACLDGRRGFIDLI